MSLLSPHAPALSCDLPFLRFFSVSSSQRHLGLFSTEDVCLLTPRQGLALFSAAGVALVVTVLTAGSPSLLTCLDGLLTPFPFLQQIFFSWLPDLSRPVTVACSASLLSS